jgi:hypothetical protein
VSGIEHKEALDQIDCFLAPSWDKLLEGECGPDREGVVPVLERGHPRPKRLRGRSEHSEETRVRRKIGTGGGGKRLPEDLEELIDFRVAREERSLGDHLCHDAADTPEVSGEGIGATSEQDLRGAIPERDHLVSEGADGRNKSPGETEVSQLEDSSGERDENVLWLEVAMQDGSGVTEVKSFDHLACEGLWRVRREEDGKSDLDELRVKRSLDAVHVFLQIHVNEFEDKIELPLAVDDVIQSKSRGE